MADKGYGQCAVCSFLLHRRYGPACPRHRSGLEVQAPAAEGRPLPSGCPSLAAVCEQRVPLKFHVPKGARRLWGQCLLVAMAAVLRYNDERAWTELMGLPKLVLRFHVRGGKGHRTKVEAESKQRLRGWLDGQRGQLWNPDPNTGQRKQKAADVLLLESLSHDRATDFLREGLVQKACAALTQAPPVEVTEDVVQEMVDKHPLARDDEWAQWQNLRRVASAAALQVDVGTVQKALSSFPRGSGAGPSGLRPLHLKEALAPGLRDEVLRHMTAVVNLMVRGEVPEQVQGWLCGASLVALPKPSGDLRPVAVGETWRRLAGKALAAACAEETRAYLEPVQLGVGSRGGAEGIVHVVRQWLTRNRHLGNKVVVTLDLANAFNSVDRTAVLAAARRVVPGIVPWRNPSHLILGNERLVSSRSI